MVIIGPAAGKTGLQSVSAMNDENALKTPRRMAQRTSTDRAAPCAAHAGQLDAGSQRRIRGKHPTRLARRLALLLQLLRAIKADGVAGGTRHGQRLY